MDSSKPTLRWRQRLRNLRGHFTWADVLARSCGDIDRRQAPRAFRLSPRANLFHFYDDRGVVMCGMGGERPAANSDEFADQLRNAGRDFWICRKDVNRLRRVDFVVRFIGREAYGRRQRQNVGSLETVGGIHGAADRQPADSKFPICLVAQAWRRSVRVGRDQQANDNGDRETLTEDHGRFTGNHVESTRDHAAF